MTPCQTRPLAARGSKHGLRKWQSPHSRFGPRIYRLRGWTVDFPKQVPRRHLECPELTHSVCDGMTSKAMQTARHSLHQLTCEDLEGHLHKVTSTSHGG